MLSLKKVQGEKNTTQTVIYNTETVYIHTHIQLIPNKEENQTVEMYEYNERQFNIKEYEEFKLNFNYDDEQVVAMFEIEDLKEELAQTDYKAIKFAEGQTTAEEYDSTKIERQTIRDKINELELILVDSSENINIDKMIEKEEIINE